MNLRHCIARHRRPHLYGLDGCITELIVACLKHRSGLKLPLEIVQKQIEATETENTLRHLRCTTIGTRKTVLAFGGISMNKAREIMLLLSYDISQADFNDHFSSTLETRSLFM